MTDDLRAAVETQPNVQEWTCFHCSETFTTYGAARDHFGVTPEKVAGCLIDRVAVEEGGKPERGRGLLMALRKVEARADAADALVERLKTGCRVSLDAMEARLQEQFTRLAEALAEVERLTAENAQPPRCGECDQPVNDNGDITCVDCFTTLSAAVREIEQGGYLQHLPDCPSLPANANRFTVGGPYRVCLCRLADRLAQLTTPTPKERT